MADAKTRVINVAFGEIGYLEKASCKDLDDKTLNAGSSNWTKYGKWYGLNPAAWCAMFVSWCFWKAGFPEIAPKCSGCYAGISWFRDRGRFHGKTGYTPQPGDIVFFSSEKYPFGGAHTGIVTDCKNGCVYTVEGNTSGGNTLIANGGGVAAKSYTLTYDPIYGYGTPVWPESEEEPELTKDELKKILDNLKNEILDEVSDRLVGAGSQPSVWDTKNELQEAVSMGITDGTRPQGYATRQEVAIMCKRAADAATVCKIDDGK